MHCSEEYLVVYSAHSVDKRSERKVSCFHRLHLFVNFRTVFSILFCVFCVLHTCQHGFYNLLDLFLFSVRYKCMFVLYFLCHFNPNIVIYSMLFGFLDLSTLYILQEANTPFSFNFYFM